MEARLPFPQGCLTPGSVPGPLWSPPSRIEWVTEGYSKRIASHSLVLKPSVMYLLCFAAKGAERRGQVGALFDNSGTCVWWESVNTSRPANTHLTPCSQDSGLRPGQMPQSPDTEKSRAHGQAPRPLTCTSPPLPHRSRRDTRAPPPGLGVLWGQPALGVTPTEGTQGGTVGGRCFPAGKIGAQSPLPPAHFNPQAEIQEAEGWESHMGLRGGHMSA